MEQDRPAVGADEPPRDESARKVFLNVGCGPRGITPLGTAFPVEQWRELRLDIDPTVAPDIVASITDMAPLPDGAVDAVWSSHNLEHLYPHEVPLALAEFLRVLRPGGMLLLAVPDLQTVARAIAEDRLDEPLYSSSAGPIAPIDIVFGLRPALAAGNHFMAHRTGFTPAVLGRALQEAGFKPVAMWQWKEGYELQVRAFRPPASAEALAALGITPPA